MRRSVRFSCAATVAALVLVAACDRPPTAIDALASTAESAVRIQLQKVLAATRAHAGAAGAVVDPFGGARGMDLSRARASWQRVRDGDRAVHTLVSRFVASPVSVARIAEALRAGRRSMSREEVAQFLASHGQRAAAPGGARINATAAGDVVPFTGRQVRLAEVSCQDIANAFYDTVQDYESQQEVVNEDEAAVWDAYQRYLDEQSLYAYARVEDAVSQYQYDSAVLELVGWYAGSLLDMYTQSGCWG